MLLLRRIFRFGKPTIIMQPTIKTMSDSIALANYFIERSKSESKEITVLKLIKLVYIAHGYLLALMEKSYLNSRYDRVEAWKLGPVIPTVYHTFKYNANNPITEKGYVCILENDEPKFVVPTVDSSANPVLDFVWKRYGKMTSSDLVSLLHEKGTPWHYCYKEGQNVVIPDLDTKLYYSAMFKKLVGYGK